MKPAAAVGVLAAVALPGAAWWYFGRAARGSRGLRAPRYEVHNLLYRFNRGFSSWIAAHDFAALTEEDYAGLSEAWANRVPLQNVKAAMAMIPVRATYVCGLNCVNACLRMWGYDAQIPEHEYPHNALHVPLLGAQRWGAHGRQYADLVGRWFEESDCCFGRAFPFEAHDGFWRILDATDFSKRSVIALTHNGVTMHYVVVLGRRDDGQEFLVTNAVPRTVWAIGRQELQSICKCTMPFVEAYGFYAVG